MLLDTYILQIEYILSTFLIWCQATYERGTRDEIEEFIYQICDVNGDGALGRYIAQVSTNVMV